jgi:hypothetical protein
MKQCKHPIIKFVTEPEVILLVDCKAHSPPPNSRPDYRIMIKTCRGLLQDFSPSGGINGSTLPLAATSMLRITTRVLHY